MKQTQYSLRKLQMAYLPLMMKRKQRNGVQVCHLCWEEVAGDKCTCCGNEISLKNDPFLNLTAEEYKYVGEFSYV
jgi:rRNA maturation endonuclease Nob1